MRIASLWLAQNKAPKKEVISRGGLVCPLNDEQNWLYPGVT